MSRTSLIFLPLYVTANVSLLYLFPPQTSHFTYTSDKKCISILIVPSPEQFSHLPPGILKEKRPALYPLALASGRDAYSSLIGPKRSMYVAGLDLGVLPIGLWSIATSLSMNSNPSIDSYPSFFSFFLKSFLFTAG